MCLFCLTLLSFGTCQRNQNTKAKWKAIQPTLKTRTENDTHLNAPKGTGKNMKMEKKQLPTPEIFRKYRIRTITQATDNESRQSATVQPIAIQHSDNDGIGDKMEPISEK
jgi:hypothetical protein